MKNLQENIRMDPTSKGVGDLRRDIDRTRHDMSGTILALEAKLNPADLREQAAAELVNIEAHVKSAVKEELHVAKDALNEVIQKAREGVKEDVVAAKDAVTKDVKDALTHAKESARAATIGKLETMATKAGDAMNTTRDTLVHTVQHNPIPAALVGVGVVWLLMNRSSKAASRVNGASSDHIGRGDAFGDQRGIEQQGDQHTFGSAVSQAEQKVAHFAHDATDAAGRTFHQATHAAGSALSQVAGTTSHLAHDATDAANRAAHAAGHAVSIFAQEVPRQARRAEQAVEGVFQDNPLAIGAAVLAAGAIVGLALPRTRREDALLGEARDHMLEGAKEIAHHAAEAVQHLGEDAAKNVKGALTASSST